MKEIETVPRLGWLAKALLFLPIYWVSMLLFNFWEKGMLWAGVWVGTGMANVEGPGCGGPKQHGLAGGLAHWEETPGGGACCYRNLNPPGPTQSEAIGFQEEREQVVRPATVPWVQRKRTLVHTVTAEHRRGASILLLRVKALSLLLPGTCRLAGAPALSSATQNFAGDWVRSSGRSLLSVTCGIPFHFTN